MEHRLTEEDKMTITIYHILFDGMLVAETGIKEKIESIIENSIKEYTQENKILKKELDNLEDSFNDVYGPRKNDTPETYNRFVMKNYPELYDKLEDVGRKVFREYHVRGVFVFSNEDYGWSVIDSKGKTWLCRVYDAKASLLLNISRERFSIKEVEIEIP